MKSRAVREFIVLEILRDISSLVLGLPPHVKRCFLNPRSAFSPFDCRVCVCLRVCVYSSTRGYPGRRLNESQGNFRKEPDFHPTIAPLPATWRLTLHGALSHPPLTSFSAPVNGTGWYRTVQRGLASSPVSLASRENTISGISVLQPFSFLF